MTILLMVLCKLRNDIRIKFVQILNKSRGIVKLTRKKKMHLMIQTTKLKA